MPTTYSDQPERILEEPHRDVPRRVISRRVEMKQPPSAGEVASRSELDEFFGPNPRAETAMLTGGAATFDVMDQSGHRRVETLREYNDQVGQGALRTVRSAFGEKD